MFAILKTPIQYRHNCGRAPGTKSEIQTEVVDYRAQPFRFEFVLDGRKRVYIVDCVRLLRDGSIEIVEIKHDVSGHKRSMKQGYDEVKVYLDGLNRYLRSRGGPGFQVPAFETFRCQVNLLEFYAWCLSGNLRTRQGGETTALPCSR